MVFWFLSKYLFSNNFTGLRTIFELLIKKRMDVNDEGYCYLGPLTGFKPEEQYKRLEEIIARSVPKKSGKVWISSATDWEYQGVQQVGGRSAWAPAVPSSIWTNAPSRARSVSTTTTELRHGSMHVIQASKHLLDRPSYDHPLFTNKRRKPLPKQSEVDPEEARTWADGVFSGL